ncbi:ABC transporter permease [Mumia sp.]|uniref:ABC transporter permease n=1 Tax=Mumia sp. TaxID=1965300 RepID=UPI0026258285|nr:ABC transporter permease [Mumia sp.]MDD9349905.1 ABC transporter permease [Mumia sp.]
MRTLVPPLLLGLLFSVLLTASFASALHSPSFHDVRIAVTGPGDLATELAEGLNQDSSLGLDARVVPSPAEARSQIEHREVYGGFVLAPGGNEVLVASAASDEIAQALPEIFDKVLASQQPGDTSASAKTVDLAPLPTQDRSGSVGYFVMIGLAIGAYFAALMLNNFVDLRLVGIRLALARLVTLAVYALVAPLPVLLIVDQVLDALPGHFVMLWLFLALFVFAIAAFANALIHFFGMAGTAVVILLVTVIGNPAAGGSVAWPLLPAFFRVVGPWTPNGAGTEGIRNIVYFDHNALGRPLLTLCLYAAVGIVLTVVAAALREARSVAVTVTEAEASVSGGGAVPLA